MEMVRRPTPAGRGASLHLRQGTADARLQACGSALLNLRTQNKLPGDATMNNDAVKRVLVYRLGSLGDMAIALPALHLVERAFPNAERRMLTNVPVASKAPSAAAVLGASGLIHSYQNYPVGVRDRKTLMAVRVEIRAWHPDVLVYLANGRGRMSAWRDALFFRLCGVKRLIGVPYTERLQNNLWQAEQGVFEPEARRLTRCVAELGDARLGDPANWDLRLTSTEQEAAARKLSRMEGFPSVPLIAVSVGTKVQAKDWGAENWKALVGRIAAAYPGYGLMLVGAEEERALCDEVAAIWSSSSTLAGPTINLGGELTPRESAAALSHAAVFLGHDSGPMHLAASVQVRCLAIFAARNKPVVWFPYGSGHEIVYHKTDCWGCGLEVCIEQKKKCLTSVTVEEVFERLMRMLPPRAVVLRNA